MCCNRKKRIKCNNPQFRADSPFLDQDVEVPLCGSGAVWQLHFLQELHQVGRCYLLIRLGATVTRTGATETECDHECQGLTCAPHPLMIFISVMASHHM